MKESKYKPDGRTPPGRGKAMYDTPGEALDELLRRIMVLGQASYMYHGAAIRLAAASVVRIQNKALHSSAFHQHKGYAPLMDVYETKDGVHVSVDEALEAAALRAELGTSTTPIQPLWRPGGRSLERQSVASGSKLAEIIAKKAGTGHGLEDEDLEGIQPVPELKNNPGLDVLRQILEDRQALMAKEEA